MNVKRTMYASCAEWFLWRVTMDRDGEIDHRSPAVNVVARTTEEAAAEAMEVMKASWRDEARRLKVLEVRALHPVNGIAIPPAPASRQEESRP